MKKKRKLRKCNSGLTPKMSGIGTNYSVPSSKITSGAAFDAGQKGFDNAMDRAGERLAEGGDFGASNGPDVAGSVVNAIGTGVLTWATPTLQKTKSAYTNGPILYLKTEFVNSAEELSKLKKENTGNALASMGAGAAAGAVIGSVVPGLGTVVGGVIGAVGGAISGIFGASKRRRELKRKMADENKKINETNNFKLAEAHTGMLQSEYLNENENTQDDVLYNNGKTPFTNGKKANAKVGKGETIIDGRTGNMTEVTTGAGVGIDDVPVKIKQEDAIAGNKINPRTGNTFANDIKPLTRMESKLKRNTDRNIKSIAMNTEKVVKAYTQPLVLQILTDQAMVHNKQENVPKYNRGKVGEYALEVGSGLLSVAPSLYNLYQGSRLADSVDSDQLYAPNAYANQAINKLASRRYNAKPEIEALRGLESRQRYNSRLMGSESGINRAMDIAGGLNMQRGISNVYGKKQLADNQYIGELAQLMASLGSSESAKQTQAMQLAYDINARNKAMQLQYKAAGLTGMSLYVLTLLRDKNRRKMDNKRMRALELYLKLGTTQANVDYLLNE